MQVRGRRESETGAHVIDSEGLSESIGCLQHKHAEEEECSVLKAESHRRQASDSSHSMIS